METPEAVLKLWRHSKQRLSPEEQVQLAIEFSQTPGAFEDRNDSTKKSAEFIKNMYESEDPDQRQCAVDIIYQLKEEWGNGSGTSGSTLTKLQAFGIHIADF